MVTGEPKPLQGFREVSLQRMLAVTSETPLRPLCPREARGPLPPGAAMLPRRTAAPSRQMGISRTSTPRSLAQPGFPSGKAAANVRFAQHFHGSFGDLGPLGAWVHSSSAPTKPSAIPSLPLPKCPARFCHADSSLSVSSLQKIRSPFIHASCTSMIGLHHH